MELVIERVARTAATSSLGSPHLDMKSRDPVDVDSEYSVSSLYANVSLTRRSPLANSLQSYSRSLGQTDEVLDGSRNALANSSTSTSPAGVGRVAVGPHTQSEEPGRKALPTDRGSRTNEATPGGPSSGAWRDAVVDASRRDASVGCSPLGTEGDSGSPRLLGGVEWTQ